MPKSNISWVLEDDFDNQIHLFGNLIKTNYKVVAYSCKCGYLDFVIKHKHDDEDSYCCQECGNTKFYNAQQAIKNTYFFLSSNKELLVHLQHLRYKVYNDEVQVDACFNIDIPNAIDFQASKLLYTAPICRKIIYT